MKRYEHFCSLDGGGMGQPEEDENGDWVRYEDAMAALAAERQRQRDKVRAHLGRTVMSVYSTQHECKAARDALQRLLDDGA
jgi:hypothetical protein